ncbi:10657_t:CDS:2 [Paraglomus occultum]|uniref:10657_t:CDS:1 n=1 Tax=Paraglomus occultum TaxID=144539 RepID=A0A9N8ZN72_9GLOM|nr:10657_t:CDS:2 [Paraglomus occultum]
MCILFWTQGRHPQYKFIFAANRDEYLNRPTSLAEWWHPTILSGVDLFRTDHGTWLGISSSGRFAALTNYREPLPPNPEAFLSRGLLVREILESNIDIEQYMEYLKKNDDLYGGFNLIAADLGVSKPKIFYYANRENQDVAVLDEKEIYGLSNSVLGNPWPKVRTGRRSMERLLSEFTSEEDLIEKLFDLLSTTVPISAPHPTSLDKIEEIKSTIRVPVVDIGNLYATRTSTVILVDHNDRVVFVERTLYNEFIQKWQTTDRKFEFHIGEIDSTVGEPVPGRTRTSLVNGSASENGETSRICNSSKI